MADATVDPTGDKGLGGVLKEGDRKTAFNPKNPGQFPGDFKIQKLQILSPIRGENKPILLQTEASAWTELNFYENIESAFISGNITINDAVGIIETTPIVGEETLEITMSSAGAKSAPIGTPGQAPSDVPVSAQPAIITNKFRIFKVDPPKKLNDNFRQIKLHFVADTQITNMMINVQKNYPSDEITATYSPTDAAEDKTFTIADMVRDIFVDCFLKDKKPAHHRPTKKNLLVEPTKGVYSASIPNWTPFKAIKFLASRAISSNPFSNGANFVFYETLKGFRFVSIETLMMGGFRGYKELEVFPTRSAHYNSNTDEATAASNKTSYITVYSDGSLDDNSFTPLIGEANQGKSYVATYSYKPSNTPGQSPVEKKYAVTNFSLIHTFDTVLNLGLGMYANRVITHDLINMKWNKTDFHYIEPPDQIETAEADGSTTVKPNPDKPADDQNTIPNNFIRSDPGKQCSNAADMLNRPEAHVSLFPTNKGISTKFAEGIRSQTFKDKEGTTQLGGDFQAKSVHGGAPSENPIEMEKRVEEWMAQRISQKRQMQTVRIQFDAPGDSAREVGDLIWFNLPSENPTAAEKTGQQQPHKYISGKFLITALRHKITNDEYTMHVEAIKDGYRSQLSPTFAPNNPVVQSPDGMSTVSSGGDAFTTKGGAR